MEQSAGAIIEYKGKYLLTRSRRGFWGFPKGHLEEGESFEDAALREVKEETGLDVVLSKKSSLIEYPHKGSIKQVKLFLAEAKTDAIVPDEETTDWKWCTKDELLSLIDFRNAKAAFLELTANDA